MAAPPSLKRLAGDQYEDAEPWFLEKFLPAFNGFATDVANALSGLLVRGENILAEEREVRVTTGASVAADEAPFPLFISPQVVRRPRRVTVSHVEAEDGSVPVGAVMVFWRPSSDGKLAVRFVSGLDASTTYVLRLLLEP